MAPQPVFLLGMKLSVEATRGVAPSSSTSPHWWEGSTWIPFSSDGTPDLADRMEVVFPVGAAGKRAMNSRSPVQGRRWSDGNFAFPIASDLIGAILYGALGSLSTNSVPSTDFTLASGTALPPATSTTVDLSAQPSDGGAILRFVIETTSNAGVISVSGVDADGRGASEVIDFSSAGSFYTRSSFSAIGPSSIIIYSDSEGSVAITGFQYWEHTITPNNASNPSFSIEKLGDPKAGAASKSFMHTGMVVQELTFNTPAAQRDGLFTGNVTWEGDPTATCDATSQMQTSAVKIWPAWGLAITRDNVNFFKVTNHTLTINAGNRNFRAAAGVQNPQGSFYGPQEVTGSMDVLVDDEEERNRWLGASSMQMRFVWDTPHKLTTTRNQTLAASMNSYTESFSDGEDDDAQNVSLDFRNIDDANHGIISFTLTNGVPPTAYGSAI